MWNRARHKMKRAFSVLAGEHGSGLMEMAIVLTVLAMVLAGIVDLGSAVNDHIIVCNASREGARYASLYAWTWSTDGMVWKSDGIIQAVRDEAEGGGLTLTAANVDIDGEGATGGNPVRVTVTHLKPTMLGDVIGLGSHLRISCSTEMVVLDSSQ